MEREQVFDIIKISITVVLTAIIKFVPFLNEQSAVIKLCLYLVVYLFIGFDVIKEAFENIIKLRPFDENFLMTIATIGAFLYGYMSGSSDYLEAIFVMLLYKVGEFFEEFSQGRVEKNITDLVDLSPEFVNVCSTGGKLEKTAVEKVSVGSVIEVKVGEKIGLDGIVIEGISSLNTSALTGESIPRDVQTGDEILSGCINLSGLLKIKTTKEYSQSTVSKVLELLENAEKRKANRENFISKFAKIYTPIVVVLAVILAFFPPMLSHILGNNTQWMNWFYRALNFLIISCPCALVISVPLSFFAGIGGASKKGILIKGANCIESLSKTKVVAFDKTGTLTKGEFSVTTVHPELIESEELLHLAAHVENFSTHPIAQSLAIAGKCDNKDCIVEDIEEVIGKGIKATVNGKKVCVGNSKFIQSFGIECKDCSMSGTLVHVAIDGVYAGHIVVADMIKEGSEKVVNDLKKIGISKTIMLTGDNKKIADEVAKNLNIVECYSQLLPQEKSEKLLEIKEKNDKKNSVVFVGDGINDALVLSVADVGISMGGIASDVAIEACDVVIMDDDISKVASSIKLSKKIMKIVSQNIVFSLSVKAIILFLSAFGFMKMGWSIFADVGVTIIAILNAMRGIKNG